MQFTHESNIENDEVIYVKDEIYEYDETLYYSQINSEFLEHYQLDEITVIYENGEISDIIVEGNLKTDNAGTADDGEETAYLLHIGYIIEDNEVVMRESSYVSYQECFENGQYDELIALNQGLDMPEIYKQILCFNMEMSRQVKSARKI